MIDPKSGNLILNNGKQVGPTDNFDTLHALKLGEVRNIRDMGNGWLWLDVKNLEVDLQFAHISFLFKNKELSGFTFIIQKEKIPTNLSWDDWDEQAEKQNAVRFNKWLDQAFQGKRAFEWGKVWAGYDAKGGSSSIRLRYSK